MKSWYKSSPYHLEKMKGIKEKLQKTVLGGTAMMPELDSFLNALYRLQTVPAEYLICQEELLPAESLRFFYVDENWVDCLIDGALSMGRNSTFDLYHDALVHEDVCRRFRSSHRGAGGQTESGGRTGFLLRSELVRGWPGLSIACYAQCAGGKELLECQNISRIGEDIILCIADGVIDCLEFTEPKEGVSFGFTRDEQGILSLPLSPLPKPGTDEAAQVFCRGMADFLNIPVPVRQQEVQGVVDIEALCAAAGKALGMSEAEQEHFSALELSAELLATPVRYSVRGDLL